MIKLFNKFTKKEVLLIIICVLLMFFQVWIELKIPEYMSEITKLIQTSSTHINEVIHAGFFMLICAFGSMISAIVIGYFASFLAASFSLNLRELIFKKVQRLSLKEMKEFSTSSLITRTTNDVTQIEMLIVFGLQALIRAPIMAIWAISKIVNKSAQLSLLVAVGVVILLINIMIIMLIVTKRFSIVQKLTDKINKLTSENLIGIRVIRAFNAEDFEINRFAETNNKLTKTHLTIQKTFAQMSPIMNIVMHFLTLGICFFGSLLIIKANMIDKLTIFSDMVVFSNYGMQVIMSFLVLASIFIILPRANVSAKRINEVLDSPISIKEGNISNIKDNKRGTLEFKHVFFKYPDADEYILKDVSFNISQGETVAIIGSTGSGKSTLVNLIPRFYDVTKGEILVDGVNVKDYKLETLYNIIGYVPQKAFIFTGSVEDNINFGKTKEKVTEEKVNEAIKVSQAKEFVSKMDKGINSHIARGGTNISGGQKQRLSIARTIAREPEIYIFDDSFSALDYKTDANLRKELKKYTKDASCLIVAQRIGTIINADKIIVLDKGKCVGIGKHNELLNSCKVYKEIALSQLSEEELLCQE